MLAAQLTAAQAQELLDNGVIKRCHFYSPLLRRWVRILPIGGFSIYQWQKLLRKYDFMVSIR
jgi:hypothetical protein